MATIGVLDSANLNGGQKLAVKYYVVAGVLLGAQILFGLLSGLQYLQPDFLFGVLDFNVNRMVHLNALVAWLLFGFLGSVYWLLEDEAQHEVVGLGAANLISWLLTAAVAVVVVVFFLAQVGPGEMASIWLINEGREYIEAPRWADIGIVVGVLVFFYNVAATFSKGRFTGIAGVLVMDLLALFGIYLAGMFYVTNVSVDQYWWWWPPRHWSSTVGSGQLTHRYSSIRGCDRIAARLTGERGSCSRASGGSVNSAGLDDAATNKQLRQTVIRYRMRATSAPFHYALLARRTPQCAAAELRR